MKFYRLDNDPDLFDRWHLEEPRLKEVDDYDFWPLIAGVDVKPIDGLKIPIQEAGAHLSFTMAAFDIPVVATGIIEQMAKVDFKGVSSVPCTVEGERESFSILVVPRLVKCVDEGRCHCTRWVASDGRPDRVGQYRMIVDLKIKAEAVPQEVDIFRVDGWNVALIVSERMRTAIESVDPPGLKFYPV